MSKKCRNDAPGMRGCRSRTEKGTLRNTRDDKHVGTVEKEYGIDTGRRADMHIGTLQEKLGLDSEKDLIKRFKN